jgi:toxin ParE1/3/4
MARVCLRPLAESDILELWEYIAGDSESAADHWVDQLTDRLDLWATQPLMGRAREELSKNLRSFPFGRYVVFYCPLDDGLDVVRVLHSSREIQGSFDS